MLKIIRISLANKHAQTNPKTIKWLTWLQFWNSNTLRISLRTMHKSSISSVEIATGMFTLLFNSLFLPMFCYLSFHFTLLYLCLFHVLPLSFHARYFHVLPLSVHIHILSLSLHAMSKSSQIEYSECMTLVTMVLTIYMCEYWEKTNIHSYKSIFFRVHIPFMPFILLSVSCQFPFHFLPCSFYFRQSYLCFTFTLFNFPPFLLFFHVLLMFLWFPFPFVSFSFSSSCHVPFILLSCHFSFLPFFLQVIPFFLYVLSFLKNQVEFPCIFVSNYVHGPWFFSWSSLLVYASGCQFIMW